MKILFIHQNFPGQFKFLAPALVQLGHQVTAMSMQKNLTNNWEGIDIITHHPNRATAMNAHPWVMDFETKVIRAESCFRSAEKLKESGYSPDIIIAHPGWGESLFLKEVWPKAKLGIYCEFYYSSEGLDVGFDPEFPNLHNEDACRLRLKNLSNLLHFDIADAAISPTEWQASSFPEPFRSKITVVHDGIDTEILAPKLTANLALSQQHVLTQQDEVITFVNRNLEPYRGYHIFMRSLPEILVRRPQAQILIVGGADVSYGACPSKEKYGERSWRDIFIDELKPQISDYDWRRIHFLGKIPHPKFISLLQISTVHVYLTYPFVLSWSLLEAMSIGCAIVASDTQPLHEAIIHNKTGKLVNFFNAQQLANEICGLLDNPTLRRTLGQAAREFAISKYDLKRVCLPRQIAWVNKLITA